MAISDLPGYVQGYVFTDSAAYYDSTNKFFIDQAGYSAFPASRLEITTGTPSFVDVNSARGMVLDNTVQGFLYPPLWHGSIIVVMGAPSRFGTNGTLYPLIGGAVASATSNCAVRYIRVNATDYRPRLVGNGSNAERSYGDDAIYATCLSYDQESRQAIGMESGGTQTAGATVADNNRAVEFTHDIGTTDATYAKGMRFGNLSGTKGDTSATANTMIICELHFFKDILTDAPTTTVEAEMAALEVIYG